MLNQINLDALKTFQSVAKLQSIKGAAKELGVTPSAVSQAIRKLEEQIGAQLFLREHKRVVLARSGLDLKRRVDPLLGRIGAEISEFRESNSSTEVSGTLSIGAPPDFGSVYLMRWFSEFRRKHPGCKLRLKLGSPRTLLAHLQAGEVDLLIADDGPYYDGIRHSHSVQRIFHEELVLCHAPSLGKVDPAFKALIELPHLDYVADGSAVGIWYTHHFRKAPKQLEIVAVSENVRALIQGAKDGLGLAMVPKHLVAAELKSGLLKVVLPTQRACENGLVLIQHQDQVPSLVERLFLAHLRAKPKNVETIAGR